MENGYPLYINHKGGYGISHVHKGLFLQALVSYEISRSCTPKDYMKAVERAYAVRFSSSTPVKLILRTDNDPQYVAGEFRKSMNIMGIDQEYIQKHSPEDNSDIESFNNSVKADYIWPNEIEKFEDAKNLMEYAFNDHNIMNPHSSIECLPFEEFKRIWNENSEFREVFLERKRVKHEREIRRREEKKMSHWKSKKAVQN
ncbi:MAG: integrase core domain-containing protein [Thermoplasmatales archaeon]